MGSARAIVMKEKDNLATAIEMIADGTEVEFTGGDRPGRVTVTADIPFGHKFAIREIGTGEPVIKYGEQIGMATADIPVGAHVHVHNVESCRGRGDK